MKEEVKKALAANYGANTKLDWIKTLIRYSDVLLATYELNAQIADSKSSAYPAPHIGFSKTSTSYYF